MSHYEDLLKLDRVLNVQSVSFFNNNKKKLIKVLIVYINAYYSGF